MVTNQMPNRWKNFRLIWILAWAQWRRGPNHSSKFKSHFDNFSFPVRANFINSEKIVIMAVKFIPVRDERFFV